MTDHDRQHEGTYPELVVGRVLDALEPADDALLSEHLGSCADCRALLTEMTHVAAALAYDTDQVEPPPALLEGIRAALAEDAAADEQVVRPLERPARRAIPRFGRRAAWIAAGIAASAALFAGGYAARTVGGSGQSATAAADRQVVEHLESGQAYAVGLVSGGAATGTAVVDGRHVDLITTGLGRNDTRSSIYVLWAAAPGSSVMTAVVGFDVRSDGTTVVDATLPAGIVDPTTFGVTHEAGRTLPKTPGQPVLGVRSA